MIFLEDQYLIHEMESCYLPQINSKQTELWGIKKSLSLAVTFQLYFSSGIQERSLISLASDVISIVIGAYFKTVANFR